MPRGDRTGPEGYGPLTGRGTGYCSGSTRPGFASWASWLGRMGGRLLLRRNANRQRILTGRGLNRRRW